MNDKIDKEKLVARLKKIEGQIRGIEKMITADKDCEDILTQILAVDTGIKNVGKIIMFEHLNSCVKNSLQNGDEYALENFSKVLGKFIN